MNNKFIKILANINWSIFSDILYYYALMFTTVLLVGGLSVSSNNKELLSNLLFLPVVFYLWVDFVKRIKIKKQKHAVKK